METISKIVKRKANMMMKRMKMMKKIVKNNHLIRKKR